MAGASQGPGTRQNVGTDFLLDALGRGRTGGPPSRPPAASVGQGRGRARGAGGAGCRSDAGAAQGGAAQLGRGPRVSSLLVDLGQQQDEGQGQGAVVEAVHVGAVPLLRGAAGGRGPSAAASAPPAGSPPPHAHALGLCLAAPQPLTGPGGLALTVAAPPAPCPGTSKKKRSIRARAPKHRPGPICWA